MKWLLAAAYFGLMVVGPALASDADGVLFWVAAAGPVLLGVGLVFAMLATGVLAVLRR